MKSNLKLFVCLLFSTVFTAFSQVATIQHYSINNEGQVQLEINSSSDKYYILQVKHHVDSAFEVNSSLTLGEDGTTIITEQLRAYPQNHYQVLEFSVNTPQDIDSDGINDLIDFTEMPLNGPFNSAETIETEHGLLTLNSFDAFEIVSTKENGTPWVEYLNGVEYTKFLIDDFYSNSPKIYFINSNTYNLHVDFANNLGINHLSPNVKKGQLIFHPSVISSNGTLGTFSFNFSNNEAQATDIVQRTHELLASNMLFLKNNFSYFVTENNEEDYYNNQSFYESSRIPVLFESNVYEGINYLGLNQTEGFGFFRYMSPGELPNSRDIVLYDVLPNSLPRVGGMITSMIQTPLSHVNLRAIHDNVPNAFIRNPLENQQISSLLNHYIYFKTNQNNFEIREATVAEVNAWFESIRPNKELDPPLNLDIKNILPLAEITFDMYDAYGAKTSNLATMKTFDFIEGTLPDGFGIPFYFYQEFMKSNHLLDEMVLLLEDSSFINDRLIREIKLAEFRAKIKSAPMPDWMMNELFLMQQSFPQGTSIRCRSSSNNEDLPGFNGAGLYDSKTQHPNEGHISKSIKQVYASLWNLRAFEEREFYRVNHFKSSMGVLCHPNFEDEKVNGVGITTDPIYSTENRFYINSQLGEELVTNPTSTYPEELLLNTITTENNLYAVIQYSSLVSNDSLLMNNEQLTLLRDYMLEIHTRFEKLYHAENNESFAMDIEFKIDSIGQLVIKQARPWVSYLPSYDVSNYKSCDFSISPNPTVNLIHLVCLNSGISKLQIVDLKGSILFQENYDPIDKLDFEIPVDELSNGIYFINAFRFDSVCKMSKFIKF